MWIILLTDGAPLVTGPAGPAVPQRWRNGLSVAEMRYLSRDGKSPIERLPTRQAQPPGLIRRHR